MEIQKPEINSLANPISELFDRIYRGRKALDGMRAGLKILDEIGAANDIREQKLHDTQQLAEDLIDAESKLGELIAAIPESQGKRTDLELPPSTERKLTKEETIRSIGISLSSAQRYESLAANPGVVEDMKNKAREAGEIVNRTAVLKAISDSKKKPFVANNSGDSEWYTPDYIIEAARKVLGTIDLDPASCTAANEIVKAEKYYTREDNGLLKTWKGRIWLNPPYSQTNLFIEKLLNSNIDEAIVLVNNATETQWFRMLAGKAAAFVFHTGRMKFYKPDKETSMPMQGQVFAYIGEDKEKFITEFSKFGWAVLTRTD